MNTPMMIMKADAGKKHNKYRDSRQERSAHELNPEHVNARRDGLHHEQHLRTTYTPSKTSELHVGVHPGHKNDPNFDAKLMQKYEEEPMPRKQLPFLETTEERDKDSREQPTTEQKKPHHEAEKDSSVYYTCPDCKYNRLLIEPYSGDCPSYEICDNCGVEYGLDDKLTKSKLEKNKARELELEQQKE